MRTDARYAYLLAADVTKAHLGGTLCTSLADVPIASDGTAVLRFVGAKPRGLFGLPTRTLPEHLAWLATLPEAP